MKFSPKTLDDLALTYRRTMLCRHFVSGFSHMKTSAKIQYNRMKGCVLMRLAIFVPIAILLGMIVPPLYTVAVGEPFKLRMEPVDPTDAFRGDYIQVNLEAETVPEAAWTAVPSSILRAIKAGS